MSRVLLDAEDDNWSVVITHDDREETCRAFPDDIQLVRLHAHNADNGVTLTLDGRTIGHLPADLAHFHRVISRLKGSGLDTYAECKVEVYDGRAELVIPYINQRDLTLWAGRKIAAHRRHEAAKRKLGSQPVHRSDLATEKVAA